MIPASKWALIAATAALVGCSSNRHIDGTSAATFERSVAMLQNDLPRRQREDFDVALAVTWMRTAALDGGDVDGDGNTDYFDARAMADNVRDLLAAIQRGDFASAIEKSKGGAVVAAYFKKLDGLGYDEVVGLAGELDLGPSMAELKRQRSQAVCAQQQTIEVRGFGGRVSRCDR